MPQFHAYRNPRQSRDRVPYLLDVQSDLLDLETRVIVPLVDDTFFAGRITRLHPAFRIEARTVIASTADMVSVSRRDLREQVADLSAARDELLAAIDFLLTGY